MATVDELQTKLANLDKQKEEIADQIRRLAPVTQGQLEDALKDFQLTVKAQINGAIETITKMKKDILTVSENRDPTNLYTSTSLGYSDFTVDNTAIIQARKNISFPKNTNMSDVREHLENTDA